MIEIEEIKNIKSLKELFKELLRLYSDAEECVIYERGEPDKELDMLNTELKEFHIKFDELIKAIL